MRPKSVTFTPQELEIMKIVWGLKRATVRDIYEAFLKERKIAYTTVLTMVKVLERKGRLAKAEEGRAPVYEPTVSQRGAIAQMVTEFIDRVFNGATRPLLMHLVDDRKLSKKDIAAIGRLLKEKKPEGKKKS